MYICNFTSTGTNINFNILANIRIVVQVGKIAEPKIFQGEISWHPAEVSNYTLCAHKHLHCVFCIVSRSFGGHVMKQRHGLMRKTLPFLVKTVARI